MEEKVPELQADAHTDRDWTDRLEESKPTVDIWLERIKQPQQVEQGSLMAADERTGLRFEPTVWYAMCVSTEHLGFLLSSLSATRTMYPTAYMTIARTSLMAAVNAVWVLAPVDQRERIKRSLKLRAEDITMEIKYVSSFEPTTQAAIEAQEKSLRQLQRRRSQLQPIAEEVGIDTALPKVTVNQTDAIEWVARHMGGNDNSFLLQAHRAIWRSGSAAAHAKPHFGSARLPQNERATVENGSQVHLLRGDLETDVGPAFGAAFQILKEAFRLYDLRRSRFLAT